jgi:hypothetical protein
MKVSQKQQLIWESQTNKKKFEEILRLIGEDVILQWELSGLEDDVELTEENIQDELDFAKENPPGSAYASQGVEARKAVKYLRGVKKQKQQLVKLFQQFIALKNKVDKL